MSNIDLIVEKKYSQNILEFIQGIRNKRKIPIAVHFTRPTLNSHDNGSFTRQRRLFLLI